jgi:protein-disulfide isomerase
MPCAKLGRECVMIDHRHFLDRALTLTLTACAVAITSLVVKRELAPTPALRSEPTDPIIGRPLPESLQLTGGRLVGSPTARLRLIEFADFECPFCAIASAGIEKMEAEAPGEIAVEFHHLVIPQHKYARQAAEAAECAADQGRFASYYFTVFANQSRLGQWTWSDFARRAKVGNLKAFEACLADRRFSERIEADVRLANSIGIRGTPSWVRADSVYGGVLPRTQIDGWLGRTRR